MLDTDSRPRSIGGAPGEGWPAPGKLNRFLHIVGQRSDGYHLLQTIFQFISVCDVLRFRIQDAEQIVRVDPIPEIPPEVDLTIRAAKALQQATGCRRGVEISLDKRLPVGGGVGGGSSDAATTLVALNELWKTRLDTDALAQLGLGLGADVPVFVRGHAAWAEGVGERLTIVECDASWFLVVVPDVHVSTKDIFQDFTLTRDTPEITIADFVASGGGNDCEPVVYRRYPQVAAVAHWLSRFGRARLTGTGGCVFVAFPEEAQARQAHEDLSATNWTGFVTQGLNRSPLLDRVDAHRRLDGVDSDGA